VSHLISDWRVSLITKIVDGTWFWVTEQVRSQSRHPGWAFHESLHNRILEESNR